MDTRVPIQIRRERDRGDHAGICARLRRAEGSIERILEGLERSPGGEFVYVMNIASIADCRLGI